MSTTGLYRYAVAASASVLILVAAGSLVTTEGVRTAIPDWPLAFGKVLPSGPYAPGVLLLLAHRALALVSLLLVAGLVGFTFRSSTAELNCRRYASAALVLMLTQIFLGGAAVLYRFPDWLGVVHALAAHVCFFLVAAVAVLASPLWQAKQEAGHDYGWPSLRTLAVWSPALVFVQITLGALYRHHITGIVPHIVGALMIGGLTLLFGLFVMTQFPQHVSLRRLSIALLSAITVQVMLGVFTYMVGAMADEPTHGVWGDLVIAGHVAVGGIVFASCALLGIQVRRCVLPKLAPATEIQAAS